MKPFEKMNTCERKVAIAEDIIAQLNSQKFTAKNGEYWTRKYFDWAMPGSSPQEVVSSDNFQCEVCARGAILMSRIRLGGSGSLSCGDLTEAVDMKTINNPDSPERLSDDSFTLTELQALEKGFEGWDCDICDELDLPISRDFDSDEDWSVSDNRLRTIAKYIIDKGGDLSNITQYV